MNKVYFFILAILFAFFGGSANVTADLGVVEPYVVYSATEKNSPFEALFEIEADENGTYSIELDEREEFSFETLSIEKDILDGDSRTFIFDGKNTQTLEDGKYRINWYAYKNSQIFDSGSFDIAAGEQGFGFNLFGSVIDPYAVYANTENGTFFKALFEIEADEDGIYAIELDGREEFLFESLVIEKDILDGDSRTFIFRGQNTQTLEDGEYRINWNAYKNNQLLDSGSFDISVGRQAESNASSGFSLFFAVISISFIAFIDRIYK